MFGIFKKRSALDKLQKQYENYMKDWYALSTTNRAESDRKYAEAQHILDQIEELQK